MKAVTFDSYSYMYFSSLWIEMMKCKISTNSKKINNHLSFQFVSTCFSVLVYDMVYPWYRTIHGTGIILYERRKSLHVFKY